ncbi:hypothetical protein RUM44_000385 [Polyplax serrata]|uniref:Tr-type G domain-containing protein n=1 Tax=Polyplax serrata TaxID=468196 RepID=A0ABR1B5A2_POLSC
MLFFSGMITHMGEVHHGNTVTDFMEQERERGITITSASVTFEWEKHKINLLDTPGHIDFTMEVEQTLNVMDGAVVILDGSAGVEAQTLTVWKQANRYNIPRIVYINKMDKSNADLSHCQESISKQLNVKPLVLQLPIFSKENVFEGVVDLLNLEKFTWRESSINFTKKALNPEDGDLWENATKARLTLIETLADLYDEIAEIIINDESNLEKIPSSVLQETLRKMTVEHKGVVVLCGSSYKNMGVQCLLDAVIQYLPSPFHSASQSMAKWFGSHLCAKAFKVRHDNFKGPITFFRIYSGNIHKGMKLFNVTKGKSDKCEKLYIAYADDYEEVPDVGMGNVCAVSGLKHTTTGDLVASSSNTFSSVTQKITAETKKNWSEVLLPGVLIPDPVFFCSIEAPSVRYQAVLDKVLSELGREDPSLKITVNDETGQTVLGGMGELHLEVIRDRIRKEYKIDAELGELQIVYKEKLCNNVTDTFISKLQIGKCQYFVKLIMSTVMCDVKGKNQELLLLDHRTENQENINNINPQQLTAIKDGVARGLQFGPKLNCQVEGAKIKLHWFELGRPTPESIITSAAAQCVKKLLSKSGTSLLEPIMFIEVVCSEKEMSAVINDLSRRRTESCETFVHGSDIIIRGLVPLSELLGYSKELRILTSGRAAFTMELHSYRDMSGEEEARAIKSVTGI